MRGLVIALITLASTAALAGGGRPPIPSICRGKPIVTLHSCEVAQVSDVDRSLIQRFPAEQQTLLNNLLATTVVKTFGCDEGSTHGQITAPYFGVDYSLASYLDGKAVHLSVDQWAQSWETLPTLTTVKFAMNGPVTISYADGNPRDGLSYRSADVGQVICK